MNEALLHKATAAGGTVLAHATVRGRGPEHALPRPGLLAATGDSLVFVLGDALEVGEASVLPGGAIRRAEFRNQEAALYLDSAAGEWVFSPLSEADASRLMQAAKLFERYSTRGQHQEPATHGAAAAAPASVDHAQWFDGSPHAVQTHPGGTANPFHGGVAQTSALPSHSTAKRKPLALVLIAVFGVSVLSALIFSLISGTRTSPNPGAAPEAFPKGPDGTVSEKIVSSEAREVHADGQLQVATNYRAGQAIVVKFSGLPGNAQDWITLVPRSAPANTYQEWFYLKGQRSGSLTFKPVTPGDYEIRAYHNWPAGGYVIHERTPLRVSE